MRFFINLEKPTHWKQTAEATLKSLSQNLISYFSEACSPYSTNPPDQDVIDEDLSFWDSLGDMIYAFNGLLRGNPLFIKGHFF